ncbi:YozE family protein [Sporomusa acidovorans]|uniref:YozE SAM-like domain-containing protein n=1 Tax=Sporomusa acidovorans (strain ATCC 49682 / DSM 3132 / Mol) TaxID=1123286 RepID=A0ABZ3IWR3_SPOA4|nr:YozE family protein [Sporomusa acidovorans]OZC23654.1 hypothetical protein SPACI_05560 [Sporomusa acidovorans DSM 3132]SDE24037.1 YozE SAM-like fold [Sporomusa acidovorans]
MSFKQFIIAQGRRDDSIGDIARDVAKDKNFPYSGDLKSLIRYLRRCDACPGALEALQKACNEWSKEGAMTDLVVAYRQEIANQIYQVCKQWKQTDLLLTLFDDNNQAEENRKIAKFKVRKMIIKAYHEFQTAHNLDNNTMAEIHRAWCASIAKQGRALDRPQNEIVRVFKFWTRVPAMADRGSK